MEMIKQLAKRNTFDEQGEDENHSDYDDDDVDDDDGESNMAEENVLMMRGKSILAKRRRKS